MEIKHEKIYTTQVNTNKNQTTAASKPDDNPQQLPIEPDPLMSMKLWLFVYQWPHIFMLQIAAWARDKSVTCWIKVLRSKVLVLWLQLTTSI